jgi:hypothetical protein
MKRILVVACILAASPGAFAQLYKWVDKDGRVSYSDQPPPAQQSKQLNLGTGQPAPPQRSALEVEKDGAAKRSEAQEKAKVAENLELKKKVDEENCNRARIYLRTVTDGGRISSTDANGERIILDDKQIEEERVKAQKAVDDACKAP